MTTRGWSVDDWRNHSILSNCLESVGFFVAFPAAGPVQGCLAWYCRRLWMFDHGKDQPDAPPSP
ncbi:MAG TPA: hypothetical protein VM389_13355 [Phycisphaerae bacterium]|nr:hypothetical protein [Phycisphaerae bacterium]